MTKFCRCVTFAALATLPGAAQGLFPAELVGTSCVAGGALINARTGVLVDLDQDGDADLFGLPSTSPTAVVVRMASGGTFLPGTCIGVPQWPLAVAATDLDGDGDQDVVVTLTTSMAVFLNNGSGGFPGGPTLIPVGGTYPYVAIGRMNSDTFPDVLLSGNGGTASQILIGTGTGSFAGPVPGPTFSTSRLSAADDDLDGDEDVHEIDAAGSFLTYRNNGSGAFAAPIVRFTVPTTLGVAAFADVNVDGFPDALAVGIAPGTGGSSFVIVALGSPGGLLPPGPIQTLGIPLPIVSVSLADFDGDGDPDLLAWNNTSGTYPGPIQSLNTAGTFGPAARLNETVITGVAIGDVTGDGLTDALFFGTNGLAALEPGLASAGLAHPTMIACGYNGNLAVADLDGDGRADAITSFNDPTSTFFGVTTFLNLDSGPAPSQTFPTANKIGAIATGDWNRDGAADVLLAADGLLAPAGPDLSMCLGSPGGALAAPVSTPIATAASGGLIAADMNQDGNLDVVMVNPIAAGQAHVMTVQLGNGAGGIGPGGSTMSICPTPLAPICGPGIALDDLDQDGSLDIVVAHLGSYSVYLGNASGTFGPGSHFGFGSQVMPFTLVVRDVNGDTIPDLLINPSTSAFQRRLGIGGGAFGPPATFPIPAPFSTQFGGPPAIGDLSGDGFPDLAFAYGAILVNTGTGNFLPYFGVAVPPVSQRVAIADVDRDLKQDLVFLSAFPVGWISVFRNMAPCNAIGFTYGFGCPGSGGFVPSLSARGCASPGGIFVLDVEHGLGGSASAAFWVGPGPTNVQVGGGCGILIQLAGSFIAPFPLAGLAVPGQGRASISVLIPPLIPSGTSLAIQAGILDPASLFQWSASNGLALTIQ